jgi:branched-chain amino acid transport system permease protein
MFSAYLIHISIIVVIYIILAISLNLAVGFTGLLNLGHIAFFGIGAYTSAILTMNGIPFVISIILAGLLSSIFGFILTKITNKLKGDYLAMATLGFSFVIYSILLNWQSLTQGPLGIPGIPKPNIFGWHIQSNLTYLSFAIIIAITIFLILKKITNSPYGKLLGAVRDDAIGIESMGKNVFKLKSQSMMISAFFAGLAGSLFAHYLSYIDPSTFYLTDLIVIFTIVIVGGLGSLKGSVVAGVVIIALPELLRFIDLPSNMIGTVRQMIYAVVLISILLFKPRGFFGRIDLD